MSQSQPEQPKRPDSSSSVSSLSSLTAAAATTGTGGAKIRFTSNLAAVLNDPSKDRNKVPYLFTKTWGNDFVESTSVSSINTVQPSYKNHKLSEFKPYLSSISERQDRHSRNKLELIKSKNTSQKLMTTRLNELDQIPKTFFDSNFSLSDKETFNALITLKIFELNKPSTSTSPSSLTNPFEVVPKASNGIIGGKLDKNKLDETESRKFILDKLGFYLDIVETQITNQITTKANTFFNAIHSQDEVQEHVLKTCTAVKSLRRNLNYLNERIVVASIRIIKLINLKIKYKNLAEKLELIGSVYQTKSTIDLHMDSAEYTGALDLIGMSQEILRQEARGVRALRNFEAQFSEAEKKIDKKLHDEFVRYLISELSRDFAQGDSLVNEEKLTSLMLGILRLRSTKFVDLFKDEVLIYLKSTEKQTEIEFVSNFDEEALTYNEDESNMRLMDRIRKLKISEFLDLLDKVLKNFKIMLSRVKSIIKFLIALINVAAGVEHDDEKKNEINDYQNENQIVNRIILKKDLISKSTHAKLIGNLRDLLGVSTDYAHEKLVILLDGRFKANEIERLSTKDFIALLNTIENFTLESDRIADKKTASLRSWVQNQANKFLHKFHNEKKDKITLALDSECWKKADVSSDIQNLADHIVETGLGTFRSTLVVRQHTTSEFAEFLVLKNEKYVIFGTVIVLMKIMEEYCQFTDDIPNLCYDAMTRLIEIFTIFNSKTYKMILGVGAVELGLLRLITFKTLAITYRSLQLVLYFLPMLKEFFKVRLNEKQSNTEKQFSKLIGDYNEHLLQLNNKLVFMIDEIFRDALSKYEVIAPVPSQCFRSICAQIERVHQIVTEILAEPTLIKLFTSIHDRFKARLKERLRELNVVNDGGPKHALIYSDMSYYIKQFKNLKGLHLITINFLDVWETQ